MEHLMLVCREMVVNVQLQPVPISSRKTVNPTIEVILYAHFSTSIQYRFKYFETEIRDKNGI